MSERTHLFASGLRPTKGARPVSFELRPGMHALVVDSSASGDALLRCLVGMVGPKRGKVHLGAASPLGSPELRAKTGSLLSDEPPLPTFSTVESYLVHVLGVRQAASGSRTSRPDELSLLRNLLPLSPAALSPSQRRLVAFSLALDIESPSLLALHDPLRDLDAEAADETLETLRKRAGAGTIVACLVPTERAAKLLADSVHDLRTKQSPTDGICHFLIDSERVREIAGRLAESSAVHFTRVRQGGDLLVGVESEESGAAAITAAICACQVEVFEVRRVGASLATRGEQGNG